jgi:hypothetical protein
MELACRTSSRIVDGVPSEDVLQPALARSTHPLKHADTRSTFKVQIEKTSYVGMCASYAGMFRWARASRKSALRGGLIGFEACLARWESESSSHTQNSEHLG